MSRKITIIVLASLTAACATNPPEQNAALECGAGGLAATIGVCLATGHSFSDCAIAGLVGSGVSALVCGAVSKNLSDRRKVLAGRENDLDARLAYVKGVNEDMAKYNDSLKQQVADLTAHTNDVQTAVKKQNADHSKLVEQRKALDEALKSANDAIASQQAALKENREFQAQHASTSQELAQQIQHEQANLQDTQRLGSAIANLKQRV